MLRGNASLAAAPQRTPFYCSVPENCFVLHGGTKRFSGLVVLRRRWGYVCRGASSSAFCVFFPGWLFRKGMKSECYDFSCGYQALDTLRSHER